jgi:hypothetical protein
MSLQDKLEFAIVLAEEIRPRDLAKRWSNPYRASEIAAKLIRASKRLRALYNASDDGCGSWRDEMAQAHFDAQVARIKKRLADTMAPHGITVEGPGDPRGVMLQLQLPRTKRKNGFGNAGYCVPE